MSAPSTPANREIVSFRSCVRACEAVRLDNVAGIGAGDISVVPRLPFSLLASSALPFSLLSIC